MAIFSWITLVLWLILIVFWLVSALGAKKSIRGSRWWGWQLGIRIALLIVVIFLIRAGALGGSFSHFFYQFTAPASTSMLLGAIGAVLCAAGVAFAIWARVYLGRNWGMPMTLQEGHELVTSGPYKFVRHPIYTGFLLAALGAAFTDGGIWLVIFVIFGIYFIYSAITEEKIMAKQFPNEYPSYMKRTKMLIPFIL